MKFITIFDAKRNWDFVGWGPIAVKIGFALCAVTLAAIPFLGINWGIDFAGGTELQVKFAQPVESSDITDVLQKAGFDKNQVQQYGAASQNEWLVRVERITTMSQQDAARIEQLLKSRMGADAKIDFDVEQGDRIRVTLPVPPGADDVAVVQATEAQQAQLSQVLDTESGLRLRRTKPAGAAQETNEDAIIRDEPYQGKVRYLVQFQGVTHKLSQAFRERFGDVFEVRRVDFVDARVAEGLKTDGVFALVVALVLILVYVAIRFDVFFAPGAIVALAHDPILALGLFVFLGFEFDITSIAAMLTILGYAINNTIVIYDRVRELLPAGQPDITHAELRAIVNRACNETLSRTINTTLTTVFTTVAVAVFSEGSVRTFAIVLSFGFFVGGFASHLIAPTVYLFFRKHFYNPAAATASTGPTKEERERGIV